MLYLTKSSLIYIKCLKYQEESKEAKNSFISLEQLYNGERDKTAEVTKVSI